MSGLPESEKYRAFIAIRIDPRAMQSLEEAQRSLQDQLPSPAIRWTPPNQIHLTLKFLGNVASNLVNPVLEALREACRPSSPFKLRLGQLGCFPGPRDPRILWVGLGGDLEVLRRLQTNVAEKMVPFAERSDDRPFQGHLTIGRMKRPDRKTARVLEPILKNLNMPWIAEWNVREVELIRSQLSSAGPIYTSLGAIGL
jgi:2'-5' RNA ligase